MSKAVSVSVSALAVMRAWLLARAYGHFWAGVSCTPENLRRAALVRNLSSAKAELAAVREADQSVGVDPNGREATTRRAAAYAGLEAAEAAYGKEEDLLPDWVTWDKRVPPSTREEAEIISWSLDSWGGVMYVVSPSGEHHYVTATGRTNWTVGVDGTTCVSIDRPGAVGVVSFMVSPKGEYRLAIAPYEGWDRSAKRSSGSRHVGAALTCAMALGVPGLVRQLRVAYITGLTMDLEGAGLPEGSEERAALEASIRTLGEELAA